MNAVQKIYGCGSGEDAKIETGFVLWCDVMWEQGKTNVRAMDIYSIRIDGDGREWILERNGEWVEYNGQAEQAVVNDDPGEIEPWIKVKKPKEKRRAPTAYNVFLKAKLEELSRTHPKLPCKERMRMAANAWRAEK